MPCHYEGEACVQALLRGFRQAALSAPMTAMSSTVQKVRVKQLQLPCAQQYVMPVCQSYVVLHHSMATLAHMMHAPLLDRPKAGHSVTELDTAM